MKTIVTFLSLILVAALVTSFTPTHVLDEYQCLPCGQSCDNETYDKPGTCVHCQMTLVKKSTIRFNTIPAEEICNYISKHPSAVLLDVRTKDEFEGRSDPNYGTLKKAINIPIQELESRIPELSKYKNKEIIVFCSHSHRSPQASYFLTQHGFSKVSNMSGGMSVMPEGDCKK